MHAEDLHWFHGPSLEPLDPINPKIQITFDQLVGRNGFEKLKVRFRAIFNHEAKPVFCNFLNKYLPLG